MVAAWHFSGCGLLGGYYLGVRSALCRRCVPRPLYDAAESRLAGASAGSLAAAAIACSANTADTMSAFESIAERVREQTMLGFDLLALVRREADLLLPDDAHARCTGKLAIFVTDVSSAPAPKLEPAAARALRHARRAS